MTSVAGADAKAQSETDGWCGLNASCRTRRSLRPREAVESVSPGA
jgi:hypothetical protein